MIDIVVTLTQLFGPAAASKLQNFRKNRRLKAAAERSSLETTWASPEAMVNLVADFYRHSAEANEVHRYVLMCDGQRIPTAVYVKPQVFRVHRLPLETPHILKKRDHSTIDDTELPSRLVEYSAIVANRLELMQVQLWNDPLYQLIGCDGPQEISREFIEVPFMKWRFTSGLLPDELMDVLINAKGDWTTIFSEPGRSFPLRTQLLPSRKALFDFSSRVCCGGLGLVVAIARPTPDSDYIIPLQVRSAKVNDGRGLLSVVPKAFHQGVVGSEAEVNVYWSAMREIYEELYSGEEVRRHDGSRLRQDWYLDKHPGMRWFRDNEGTHEMELVSFGVNAISGNFENALLLVIRDTSYWKQFGSELRANWESNDLRFHSTRKPQEITRVITEEKWTTESVFHIGEALLRLKQLCPHQVDLPNLSVEFD